MTHARADVCPPVRLQLKIDEQSSFVLVQCPAGCKLESFQVELYLLFQTVIQKSADRKKLIDASCDVLGRETISKELDHQGIELGVVRFLDPVVFEHVLEQRIDILVVLYA